MRSLLVTVMTRTAGVPFVDLSRQHARHRRRAAGRLRAHPRGERVHPRPRGRGVRGAVRRVLRGRALRRRGLGHRSPRDRAASGRHRPGRRGRSSRRTPTSRQPSRCSTPAPDRCSATSSEDTGLIDPRSAAAAIVDRRTAAIVPVHLYGQACDMDDARRVGAATRPAAARGRRPGPRGRASDGRRDGAASAAPRASRSTRAARPRGAGRRRRDLHPRRRRAGRARPTRCATSASTRRAEHVEARAGTSAWTACRRRCCGSSFGHLDAWTAARREARAALPRGAWRRATAS